MSSSLALPGNTDQELSQLNTAINNLKKVVDSDEDEELVETTRDLAIRLSRVAKRKIIAVEERQLNGEDVDGRAFSPVSTALEKVTRALDAMSKRKQGKVEEATAKVNAEVERVKLQRGGTDLSDIAKILFPFQGVNRPTASPVMKTLNDFNVKVVEPIDAEMEEIVDEEEEVNENSGNANSNSHTNTLSGCLA